MQSFANQLSEVDIASGNGAIGDWTTVQNNIGIATANTTDGNTTKGIAGFNSDVPAAMWEYEFVRKGSDYTPPGQVTDIVALAGEYSNAVTWVDVQAETGETYSVYASRKPFTDTSPTSLIGNTRK